MEYNNNMSDFYRQPAYGQRSTPYRLSSPSRQRNITNSFYETGGGSWNPNISPEQMAQYDATYRAQTQPVATNNTSQFAPYTREWYAQQQQLREQNPRYAGTGGHQRAISDVTRAGNWLGSAAGNIGAGVFNALLNNRPHTESNRGRTLRNHAELHEEQRAQQNAHAAQHEQAANRDPRVEGDKDAATTAAAHYNQKVAQISGAAGGGAAAVAAMNTVDPSQRYDVHMNQANLRRQQGQMARDAAMATGQTAIRERGRANDEDEYHNDFEYWRRMLGGLNDPGGDSPPPDSPPEGGTPPSINLPGTPTEFKVPPAPVGPTEAELGRQIRAINLPQEALDILGPEGKFIDEQTANKVNKIITDKMGPNAHTIGFRPGETRRWWSGQQNTSMDDYNKQGVNKIGGPGQAAAGTVTPSAGFGFGAQAVVPGAFNLNFTPTRSQKWDQ